MIHTNKNNTGRGGGILAALVLVALTALNLNATKPVAKTLNAGRDTTAVSLGV